MLSILIPAYQFSVQQFVQQLHFQASELAIPFEIRIYDDASGYDYEKDLGSLLQDKAVVFERLPENLGRSRIRNKLSKDARYKWLLFADADSLIPETNYLKNYWQGRSKNVVLVGGTQYTTTPPTDHSTYFRWYYGKHREQRPAAVRSIHPYSGFSTHHFFCHRSVFESVQFPEEIHGYGHEDTVFGIRLKDHGVQLRHLDNPLIHTGLEPTQAYLDKSREALRNMIVLQEDYPQAHTRLTQTYDKLAKRGMAPLLQLFYQVFRKALERNFMSGRPSLRLFDLYRLGYYTKAKRAKKK